MSRNLSQSRAFTVLELVVVLAVVAILVTLAFPAGGGCLVRGLETQTVNNGRQIYLATFNMATDGTVQNNERLAWPGDLRAAKSPQNKVTTVPEFINRLIEFDYLKPSDVAKVTAAPGVTPWNSAAGPFDGDKNCAFKIYTITAKDGAANIFLATKNFTYHQPLDAKKDPYKDKGFIIMRKGGDGAALRPKQTQSLQVLGLLPGRTEYGENDQETPEDTLIQK